jgi:hypothetical protein
MALIMELSTPTTNGPRFRTYRTSPSHSIGLPALANSDGGFHQAGEIREKSSASLTIVMQAEAMRVVETALALPTAVVVGKHVLVLLEGRGWIANPIISRLSKWQP